MNKDAYPFKWGIAMRLPKDANIVREIRNMQESQPNLIVSEPMEIHKSTRTPPPIYKIPTRDVVPGMFALNAVNRHCEVAAVETEVDGSGVYLRILGPAIDWSLTPGATLSVSLPDLSPREMYCTCWKPAKEPYLVAQVQPSLHMKTCPVAPVAGLHGGMRLWPAPAGPIRSWSWNDDGYWLGSRGEDDHRVVAAYKEDVIMTNQCHAPMWRDIALQAFFHPPTATFEEPECQSWEKCMGDNPTS